MARDLISRDAAIDMYGDWYVEEGTEEGFIGTVKQLLEGLPSAQPEITHCAECIHWKHSMARKSYCEVFDWMNTAEDFCSFAERE